MIEKQLLTLCLKKDFYKEHRNKLSKSLFTNGVGNFFETIQKAHDEYNTDLSLDELSVLHTEKYNPALTRASRHNFSELITELRDEEEPNENVIGDIIESLHRRNMAHKIAVMATEMYNNTSDTNFTDIQTLIDESNGVNKEEYDNVTDDINLLLESLKDNTKWKFNLSELRDRVNGIGDGNFLIVFARPESGKTAFWVNMVAGQGGFASQGAKVCALINEEPAIRTQMRLVNAHTGMSFAEIKENPTKAGELWSEIKSNMRILDTVDWSLDKIDSYVAKEKPDILIIDQLDKVHIPGTFARTDEKLRAIYTGAREIAKRRSCALVGISQASADASGKMDLTFDMMENSKTGKAAEADVIIGVGFRNQLDIDQDIRSIAVSKNKITGYHGTPTCYINKYLSRYTN